MHLEARGSNEEARPSETFVLRMIAQHVANVLTEKTFDTLAEFLYAIDVALIHLPFNARTRLKCGNFLVDFVIPGNVGDQILDQRKSFQRRNGDRLIERQRIEARLA